MVSSAEDVENVISSSYINEAPSLKVAVLSSAESSLRELRALLSQGKKGRTNYRNDYDILT